MDKKLLEEYNNLINEEIQQYTELRNFYELKKTALVAHNTDDLLNVDTEISEVLKVLQKLAKTRFTLNEQVDEKNVNLSYLIKVAHNVDKILADEFSKKQEILKKLAKEIKTLEETNLELTKQGLEISSKIIKKILQQATSIQNGYNSSGQNQTSYDFSLIEESV